MKNLIFVVEDEKPLRELYTYALNNEDFEAKCFERGEDMIAALATETPDLFLLDIMLDGMDGYEILKKIKVSHESIPVIMVSAKVEEMSKVRGLDLGADDYIAKPFGVFELIARIKANIRKVKKTENKKFVYKDILIDDSTHEIVVNQQVLKLTIKEYNLIKMLVKAAQTVVGREEFFAQVWGEDFFGETRTLDIHIKDVRKKLSEAGSAAEIVTVRSVGYKLV